MEICNAKEGKRPVRAHEMETVATESCDITNNANVVYDVANGGYHSNRCNENVGIGNSDLYVPVDRIPCHRCPGNMRFRIRKVRCNRIVKCYPTYRCVRKECQTFCSPRTLTRRLLDVADGEMPHRVSGAHLTKGVQKQLIGAFGACMRANVSYSVQKELEESMKEDCDEAAINAVYETSTLLRSMLSNGIHDTSFELKTAMRRLASILPSFASSLSDGQRLLQQMQVDPERWVDFFATIVNDAVSLTDDQQQCCVMKFVAVFMMYYLRFVMPSLHAAPLPLSADDHVSTDGTTEDSASMFLPVAVNAEDIPPPQCSSINETSLFVSPCELASSSSVQSSPLCMHESPRSERHAFHPYVKPVTVHCALETLSPYVHVPAGMYHSLDEPKSAFCTYIKPKVFQ